MTNLAMMGAKEKTRAQTGYWYKGLRRISDGYKPKAEAKRHEAMPKPEVPSDRVEWDSGGELGNGPYAGPDPHSAGP